jgi:branched-chain amino acid transport system substrate-binding protein
MPIRFVAVALAATLLCAAGCGGGGHAITLGVLSDCGGYFGSQNELSLGAVELPLLERGARLAGKRPSDGVRGARVAGKPVDLVVRCSDTNDLRLTIDEARPLVEKDGAQIVIGPTYGLTTGLVLREIARRHPDVAFLVTDSPAQETTLHDPAPNLFRFGPDLAQLTAGLGSYAYHELGWRTAAIVASDWVLAWPQAAGFVAEFCSLGGRVIGRRWLPLGSPQLAAAAKVPRGVDGVALMTDGFVDDPLGFAKAYAKVHSPLARHLVLGPHVFKPFGDPRMLARTGRSLAGVVASVEAPYASARPAWLRFRREYAIRFPGLRLPAAPADFLVQLAYYNAVQAMLVALEQVDGDLSGGERRFMEALAKVELNSPTGRIRLDANRQAITSSYLSRIEIGGNGKPMLRTLRIVPEVEQTFGGYFSARTAPPTRTTPACRRTTPPRWAR